MSRRFGSESNWGRGGRSFALNLDIGDLDGEDLEGEVGESELSATGNNVVDISRLSFFVVGIVETEDALGVCTFFRGGEDVEAGSRASASNIMLLGRFPSSVLSER